jgi:Putative transposase of IS4/5 family (DUF4096)
MDCGTASSRGLKICCRAVMAPPGVTAIAGNRLFVEAVIWKLRAGAPWRDLPERFGGWSNTHKRFSRRPESGVWEESFQGPGGRSRQRIRDDLRDRRQSPSAQRRRA